ncbi:MAG: iron-sulfur cluster assembly protein [Vicinamibacterales bacterium]|nr:iron-sulfur cluster assembly protein [Vicinamibacterales bacterium]HJN43929.1 iron-sulfur cluster assembly protein [Vicinamibacterales bacterium]
MGIFNFNSSPETDDPKTPVSTEARASEPVPATAVEMTPPPVDPPRAILPTQPPVPAPATTHDPIDSDPLKTLELKPKLIEALSTVYDPEIPVNIYEMGLIYDVDVNADGLVGIRMTLTSPACPAAQSIPVEVEAKAKAVPGVSDAWVDVVWEPTWDMSKMSEAAKLQLGLL